MNHVEKMAAKAALRQMLNQGFFSICTIDKIIASSGVVPDRRAYNALNLLHCVHYKDMEPDLVRQLPILIERTLGGPVLAIADEPSIESDTPKVPLWKRVLLR